jgi:multidrug efflux system membrane fusion protein
VVPDAAIQQSQAGPYVWLITPDRTAQLTPVTVNRSIDGKSVLTKGVKDGDLVVTDGGFRLANGTKVNIRDNQQASAASGATQ